MDGQDKPVSSKTVTKTTTPSEKTPVKVKASSKGDSAKKADGSKSGEKKSDKRRDSTGGVKLMEIKKEVMSEEGEESDDAPDERLVIDEGSNETPKQTTKAGSKTDARRTSSEDPENKTKSSEKKSVDAEKSGKKVRQPIRISLTPKGKTGEAKSKATPRAENGLNHSSSSSSASPEVVASTSTVGATPVKTEMSFWEIPFQKGWKREIVHRATVDPNPKRKMPSDVYYFAPCGSKLRSMREVLAYLKDKGVADLFLSNFTFLKQTIYHPPEEVTRQARANIRLGKDAGDTTSTPKPKKSTPKAKPPPITPLSVESFPPPTTPLFASGESEVLNTKRWRKRKALPPDFVNTDRALSQRSPKFPSPPTQTVATVSPATTATVTPTAQSKPVKPSVIGKDTPVSAAATTTTGATTTTTTTTATEDPKLLSNKRVIKRKIIQSPEENVAKKPKVGQPVPIRKSLVGMISSSGKSTAPTEKNHSANKVVFTFSRMGNREQQQQQLSGKYTVLRVNPLQNPCTLSCPGLQGQVPDLHCSICLLLFHSQCVGCTADFVCQRCKKLAQHGSTELSPAPIMNGDSHHETETSPPPPEEKAEPDPTPSNNNTDYHFDKTSDDDQVLEDVDLASDDDDENFMTVTPEVVMSPTLKETPMTEQSDDQPKFIPPLPPLVRAPTSAVKVPGVPTYPRLPRVTSPPALVRPMITLAPPFGAASNQLRTLVSQLPPRPIFSQTTTPMAAATCTTIATVVPLASAVGSPVTSFLAPVVSPSGINVNLLSNSAPIIVGSQVLTPVSISMPGIAKGTVIYTNNPTLRFLLPSSTGMQAFIPNKPVVASPPTAITTTSTSTTPIVSPGDLGVTVSSKVLVQKPPLVINKKGRSLCELMLMVGKAEKGQKIKMVETDAPPEEEVSKVEKSDAGEEKKESEAAGESVAGESVERTEGGVVGETVADGTEKVVGETEKGAADETEKGAADETKKGTADETEKGTADETVEKAVGETEKGGEADQPLDQEMEDTKNESEAATDSVEPDSPEKKESTEQEASSAEPDATEQQQQQASFDEGEMTSTAPPEAEKSTVEAQLEDDPLVAATEEEELRAFSPIFTEEELRDWDRESVSSNDEEEEYRPESPVVLATLPYQDGYTRIRSLALTNRGAQLSCPSGKCARASFYRRPVTDLYADQEHAYCSPRARQLFKQAGRKSMMTVNPPRRALHQIQSACDALSNIFEFLNTADLLRASRVCRTWRKLASQPHQWATVKLKGLKVNNWKTCARNLEFYGTTMLDMHGLEQDTTGWHQFVSHIHHLRKLQALILGTVPAWVMQAVALALPQLLCLEAEYIQPTSSSEPEKGVVSQVDPGWWSSLPHLTVLRLRAPEGMTPAPFTPHGGFRALSNLNSLTHLSLTSLRSFPKADVDFLERLPQLQVLELGQCKEWNDQAYQRLGKLRSLRRLRLEIGGGQGDRGLANALGQMNRLEELTLLSFKVTTSLAASIRRLRHLWHLTIWPDMTSEGAMVVYNTLQAVRSLKKLQSFSWGIIFTESKEIRYSKKSTKYREAVDVNEWWSGELRKGHRAKSIKIPLLKAFSDEAPTSNKAGVAASASNSMEQGLIGVGHLKHKLNKLLPDVEIYVYQVPDNLLTKVYGVC